MGRGYTCFFLLRKWAIRTESPHHQPQQQQRQPQSHPVSPSAQGEEELLADDNRGGSVILAAVTGPAAGTATAAGIVVGAGIEAVGTEVVEAEVVGAWPEKRQNFHSPTCEAPPAFPGHNQRPQGTSLLCLVGKLGPLASRRSLQVAARGHLWRLQS